MHSVFVICGGLIVLALFVGVAARWTSGARPAMARAALIFIPVWLICAAINMFVGVVQAGYTVVQELPFFAVVFGVPALAAFLSYRTFSREK